MKIASSSGVLKARYYNGSYFLLVWKEKTTKF